MIAIVDYGVGNLLSIKNMIKKIKPEEEVLLATSSEEIKSADKLILPGVGAFDTGMNLLNNSGFREELDRQVMSFGKPLLGICLGMQMLGKKSEEGKEEGLGYIDFECKKFHLEDKNLKVPHMGWDYVDIKNEISLVSNHNEKLRFYFVHSYYAVCKDQKDVFMTCDYGGEFVAAVNREKIYGVQFHPEKSHRYGMWLMKNFIEVR